VIRDLDYNAGQIMFLLQFTIDWNSLATRAVGGLIVFLVTLVSEYFVRKYERYQDKAEQQIVRFKHETRTITGAIFSYLGPGSSVESDLGPPNRQFATEAGLYSAETLGFASDHKLDYSKEFTAYLYLFKNGQVKILSEDKETIVALTVMANGKDILLPFEEAEFLNSYMIELDFFDDRKIIAEHMPGCSDTVTALSASYYRPSPMVITYFCYHDQMDYYEADVTNNPKELIGARINGVCISSDLENVSYLYLSELV
jgi:hypothetical protein